MHTVDIPSDPIGVNVSDPTAVQQLQTAFEAASKTPQGEKAIAAFWGGARHLFPAKTEDYKKLIDAANSINLSREDIFGF